MRIKIIAPIILSSLGIVAWVFANPPPGIPGTTYGLISAVGQNIGIGTSSPGAKLDVAGNIKISGLTILNNLTYAWPSSGIVADRVLTTDGSGNLRWAAPPSSGGTVMSVGLSPASYFTLSGSPVTTNGTLSFAWSNQNSNLILAGPVSGSAAPTFRGLVAADIPNLDASKITTGTFAAARIPDLNASQIKSGIFYIARLPYLNKFKI